MGIFKDTRKRNIFIYIISGLMVIASAVIICIAVWPRKEDTPETPKNTQPAQQQEPQQEQSTSDGPLYTIVPCEEAAAVTGEECPPKTESPSYPSYTPNYSTPEPTTTPSQTPQYSAPTPEHTPTPAPAPTPTCAEYHATYYQQYTSGMAALDTKYNSAISNASMNCSGHGGCPAVTNLKRQKEAEAQTLKSTYKNSMTSSGCDPSEYVDF